MADTYTTNLRLVQQVNGENAGNWGDNVDAALEMLEDAISDVQSITLSSTSKTLSTNNNTADESRAAVLDFSGTPGGTTTVTLPDVDKVYIVSNGCTDNSDITLTKGSGDTATVYSGARGLFYVKAGAGVYEVGGRVVSENDTGAGLGPNFTLYREATGSNSDLLGALSFQGQSTTSAAVAYARLLAEIVVATNGSEDGGLRVQTYDAGSLDTQWHFRKGFYYEGGSDPGNSNIAADQVHVADQIAHVGDTNNNIAFSTDTQLFVTGNVTRLGINDSGVQVGNSGARVTTILDEDAMGSNSATALATQQSIKAYVDSQTASAEQTSEWIPAGAMFSQLTTGAASGFTESTTHDLCYPTFDFDTSTQEHVQFIYSFTSSWDAGTVTFIPYWTAASGSGTVTWALQGRSVANDAAIDGADFGTAQTSTDTLLLANDVHVGPTSSAITITSAAATVPTWFRIYRPTSDTLAADAKLIGIVLNWTNS